MRRVLHAAVAARRAPASRHKVTRAAAGAVLRWEGEGSPRTVARRIKPNDPAPASYRAVLMALSEARRLGARTLVLEVDDADLVSRVVNGEPPGEGALVPYLQIQAMLHAFRSVRVTHVPSDDSPDSSAAAAAASASAAGLDPPVYADLPLWERTPPSQGTPTER